MLTVKVQDLHGGESVFQARHVVATRHHRRSDNIKHVECFDERYESIAILGNTLITHGMVYVMNDNGKTVAVYYLAQDEKGEPQGIASGPNEVSN